jgi:hypothetical protein
MNKSEALAVENKRLSRRLRPLNNTNTHFSNINSSKEVWWLDIPLEKIRTGKIDPLHLLLYDDRSRELHHLEVPIAYFRRNMKALVIRPDKDVISLELSAARSNRFQDVRPTGGRVPFCTFLLP